MAEAARHPARPRLGPDGRPERPASINTAALLGFVQAGLSALATAALLISTASLASQLGIGMGEAVWIIAVPQFIVAVLLLSGALRLRSGKSRSSYVTAAVLHLVNCLCWLILFVAWSANPTLPLIPLLLAIPAVIGLPHAAKPTSSEYLRTMATW